MSTAPPFGLILPGRPVLTNPSNITPTQYAFAFSSAPNFSHIVVFLLPGAALSDGTLAGVFIQLPGSADFKLLGAIGTERQSAMYRVSGTAASGTNYGNGVMEDEMIDIDATSTTPNDATQRGNITIGISIEPAAIISAQLEIRKAPQSSALVVTKVQQQQATPLSTKALAQRIIRNAFNFLASFAGNTGGQEVVPLKSFQDWWSKFERRIENDPEFLEREVET